MAKIGVFLGSAVADCQYSRAAEQLGRNIAKQGHSLVCGANGTGLMGILIGSVLDGGGEVFGILPADATSGEIPHAALTNVVIVVSVSERKKLIRELSDVILAFPGGIGTLDEFFEAYALKRMGLLPKPIGLLNMNNFYQPLLHQIDNLVLEGFAKAKHRDLIVHAQDPDTLLERVLTEFERSRNTANM